MRAWRQELHATGATVIGRVAVAVVLTVLVCGGRTTMADVSTPGQAGDLELVYRATRTPILKLAVYEPGRERSMAYAWADPGAGRIGINLRSVQAGFTAEQP